MKRVYFITLYLVMLLGESLNAYPKIKWNVGYVRYIPLDKNWTGDSHGGVSGKGPEGNTEPSNGLYTSVLYAPHQNYGFMLEILYWRQKLEEYHGCIILPSHYLTITPLTLACRIEPTLFRFNPYFDIGVGMYFQHLRTINNSEEHRGMTIGAHIGGGLRFRLSSILYFYLGSRVFFAHKKPTWIRESSLWHDQINFDGIILNSNLGVNF
jgi:hypothetical protein